MWSEHTKAEVSCDVPSSGNVLPQWHAHMICWMIRGHIMRRFVDGGRSLGKGKDFLSAVQHKLRKKRTFPKCWRFVQAWTKKQLPIRAPPLPVQVGAALARLALSEETQG